MIASSMCNARARGASGRGPGRGAGVIVAVRDEKRIVQLARRLVCGQSFFGFCTGFKPVLDCC